MRQVPYRTDPAALICRASIGFRQAATKQLEIIFFTSIAPTVILTMQWALYSTFVFQAAIAFEYFLQKIQQSAHGWYLRASGGKDGMHDARERLPVGQ